MNRVTTVVISSRPFRNRRLRWMIELVAALAVHLSVGYTYRVDGILHDYLGPAISPDTGGRVHAFGRREWRPDTPDQLPVTLVPDASLERSVTRPVRRDWLTVQS